MARLPARDRGRELGDGRDGQGRRPVLLLQADPADPQHGPAVDADARGRGPRDQHRPGRLRRPRDGPHRPPRRPRRQGFPSHRPDPADRGAGDRHLRGRRPRAPVDGATARGRDRGDRAAGQGRRQLAAGRRRDRRRDPRRLRDPALGARLRQLPDPLRLAPDRGRARRHRHRGAAARGIRGQALGLLGAPSRPGSVPRPDPARSRARAPRRDRRDRADHRAADPRRADANRAPPAGQRLAGEGGAGADDHGHRRLVGDRKVGGAEDRRRAAARYCSSRARPKSSS